MIVHAGGKTGPSNVLKFRDYRNKKYFENFMTWVEEMLVQNLSRKCLIAIDITPFHSAQKNKCECRRMKHACDCV
jgi:hypothetical protein